MHDVEQTKQHTQTLTSHGAEPKVLLCVVVVSGTTPPHAITAPVSGAVSVVAATVEEGKVAQSAIGVSTYCCHNGWNEENTTVILFLTYLTILPCDVFFRVWGL